MEYKFSTWMAPFIKLTLVILYLVLISYDINHVTSKQLKHSRPVYETMHVVERNLASQMPSVGLSYFGFDWYMHPKTVHSDEIVSAPLMPELCKSTTFEGSTAKDEICAPSFWQRTDFCPEKKGTALSTMTTALTTYTNTLGSDKSDVNTAIQKLWNPENHDGMHGIENVCVCMGKTAQAAGTPTLAWSNPTQSDNCRMQQLGYHHTVLNDDATWSLMGAHSPHVLRFGLLLIMFLATSTRLFDDYSVVNVSPYIKDYRSFIKIGIIALTYIFLLAHRTEFALEDYKTEENGTHMPMERIVPNGSYFYVLIALTWYSVFAVSHEKDRVQKPDETFDPSLKSELTELKPIVPAVEVNKNLDVSKFSTRAKKVNAYVHTGATGEKTADYDATDAVPTYKKWAMLQIFVWPLIFLTTVTLDMRYGIDVHLELIFIVAVVYGVLDWALRRVFEGFRLFEAVIGKDDTLGMIHMLFGTFFTIFHFTVAVIVFGYLNYHTDKSSFINVFDELRETQDPATIDKAEHFYHYGSTHTLFLVYIIIAFVFKLISTSRVFKSVQSLKGYTDDILKMLGKWDTYMDFILNVFVLVFVFLIAFNPAKDAEPFAVSQFIIPSASPTAREKLLQTTTYTWSAGWSHFSSFPAANH